MGADRGAREAGRRHRRRPRSAAWPRCAKRIWRPSRLTRPGLTRARACCLSAQGSDGPDPRWKSLCPRLCVETVPGNHYSMLRKPNAGVLAARLGVYLEETAPRGPAARDP